MPGIVRTLAASDFGAARDLYNQLTVGPPIKAAAPFEAVLSHPGTRVFGAFAGGDLRAMVTLHLLPNAVWGGRPYGLVENVVTHMNFRQRGFGRAALQAAIDAAWAADAHKIMLLTGAGRGATGFYEALGFSSKDKTAMVMRRP